MKEEKGFEYADVIIDISHESVDRPFTYRIPGALRGVIETGMSVLVPFGAGNTQRQGYVVALRDKILFDENKIKDIADIASQDAAASAILVRLAGWIRAQYGSTMIAALKTVLPAKQKKRRLEKREICLLIPKEEAEAYAGQCREKKRLAMARLLLALAEEEQIPMELAREKLHISPSTISALEKQGAIKISTQRIYRNPVAGSLESTSIGGAFGGRPCLSDSQQNIVDSILRDYDMGIRKTYLIHGITGSGKTEVYMNLIEGCLQRGRQAIVLIPEIALTYQTVVRFFKRFGERVSILHSGLSDGEKYDQCERAKHGDIDVIIGPRSALFTPFSNVGLIVIDEEHEPSYKSEVMPKYHARECAVYLASLHHASVVLGSATPSLESYYRAERGEYGFFYLGERLTGNMLPTVYRVDLRQELRGGNRSVFSGKLQELIADRLAKGEQIMLFLNRRGYAGFVSCRNCGHVMQCPHCSVSLSEHRAESPHIVPKGGMAWMTDGVNLKDGGIRPAVLPRDEDMHLTKKVNEGGFDLCFGTALKKEGETRSTNGVKTGKLICHYCGYEEDAVQTCPSCGSKYILGFRAGTEAVEEKLHQMYPRARVLRMDGDTTKKKDSYEKILSAFADREADILLGTQMIVKGHDFPAVTLVGILAADMSLFVSDYRAAERTFQLLTQAAGRAGRGNAPGEVVIQTYQPDHYSIVHAAAQNYKGFYEEEILYREIGSYPPAAHMMAVLVTGSDAEGAWELAQKLASLARESISVLGPGAASLSKLNDVYRFVFYLKNCDEKKLAEVRERLENEIQSLQKQKEQVQFDIDPMSGY